MSSLPTRRSFLIVEDEAMISMMLEDFLESLGQDLHGVASTLEEGLSMAKAGGFQVAILDCNLAGQQVWPIADVLAERSVPFLLSSGASAADIPSAYAEYPLLEKPYTMGAVAEALDKLSAAKE